MGFMSPLFIESKAPLPEGSAPLDEHSPLVHQALDDATATVCGLPLEQLRMLEDESADETLTQLGCPECFPQAETDG